jgi:hypothetical protein
MIATASPRSGTKYLSHDVSLADFPRYHKPLSGTNTRHYLSCGFKFGSLADVHIFKFSRVGANAVYTGNPQANSQFHDLAGAVPLNGGATGTMNDGGGNFTASSGVNTSSAVIESVITADVWHFYECIFYTGTLDNSDAFFLERFDGVETLTWENRPLLKTGEDNSLPDWFMTPVNGFDQATAGTAELDTLYIDESNARVVMTDNAVYANSTKWAAQPIATYADGLVECTRKRQVFGVGEAGYLHLFNDAGTLIDSSSAFFVSEDA